MKGYSGASCEQPTWLVVEEGRANALRYTNYKSH